MEFPGREVEVFLNRFINTGEAEWEALHREGSHRKYFRVRGRDNSLVFCQTYPFLEENDDFVSLSLFLKKQALKVPEIIATYPQKGWILLEDGGSIYLETIVRELQAKKEFSKIKEYYAEVIKELYRWHKLTNIPEFVKRRFFDKNKFTFEINFFLEKIKKFNLYTPPLEVVTFLEDTVDFLCSKSDFVFTHRDFHSRNILYRSYDVADFTIIDYQDARMGLPWYDLSSLLLDPYVEIDRELVQELFGYYYSLLELPESEKEYHLHVFYLQGFQRLVKALGSFLYLGLEQGKENFFKAILPGIHRILLVSREAKFPDSVYVYFQNLKEDVETKYSGLS